MHLFLLLIAVLVARQALAADSGGVAGCEGRLQLHGGQRVRWPASIQRTSDPAM
jgi:hypothetical protein